MLRRCLLRRQPQFAALPATNARELLQENDVLQLNPKVKLYANVRPTPVAREQQTHWRRKPIRGGNDKAMDFTDVKHHTLDSLAAVTEANRCLKCADAPCQHSCPTTIDIKHFIQCISTNNFYGAAKTILSDNPLGLSCGHVCPTEVLCVGGCNMNHMNGGPINIGGLQAFAVSTFMQMNIPQSRLPDAGKSDPQTFSQKVAIIGAGPASISCATYLARLGYTNVDMFEKAAYGGGLSAGEIPQFRLGIRDVQWELKQCEDLGVKVHYNKEFGKDITADSLKKDGYAVLFLGIGLPAPNIITEFKGLTPAQGFYTSKSFLPPACEGSKQLPGGTKMSDLPDMTGKKVIVLGAGDTAFDCACSAFRLGADRVIITFRRSSADMKAVDQEFLAAREELVEFLPYCAPKRVLLDDERKKIVGLELYKMEKQKDGSYTKDEDQVLKVKCDYIVSAFGSELPSALASEVAKLSPTALASNGKKINVAAATGQIDGCKWAFAGGDCTSGTITVEAANDGKTASWSMHKFLHHNMGRDVSKMAVPDLPKFRTAIDDVDLTVNFCGMKFPNPFGIASATNATSAAMIGRAFDAGFGFAVTKTFSLDKDLVTNVSPRIVRGSTKNDHLGPHQGAFLNIELISEKTAAYWFSCVNQLKRDYPDRIVIASVMAGYNKEDWQELIHMCNESLCDAVEMNLSCPHGMGEKGMGLACGQSEVMVENISRWCVEASKKPCFPKMTPNITEVATIARAAMKGGATGVTAVNTVSSLMDLKTNGEPWPAVGTNKHTTFGGMSGDANRPIALRAVASISTKVPGTPIMATGGASSANNVIDFLHCGASVVQICSAIQNQDFTVVDDYITGLKTHLYMQSRPDLRNWNRQHPPLGPPPTEAVSRPTRFGAGLYERWAQRKEEEKKRLAEGPKRQVFDCPPAQDGKVPSVNDIIGKSLQYMGTYTSLSQTEQAVAIVDENLCVNCLKCYSACNDSGYQAITADPVTHMPRIIEEKCTACGICGAVCPIEGCISFVPKTVPHVVHRGILEGKPQLPVATTPKM